MDNNTSKSPRGSESGDGGNTAKSSDLRTKTISNLLYSFFERIGAQLISLLVTVVLARILMPEQYGVVALITVIINLCNVFVTYGFGNSLIQKKDADDLDYSTCFYSGLAMSALVYAVVFAIAPFVADYYGEGYEQLAPIMRVMGLKIILAAVNSIQKAYVSRHMIFKKFFYATLVGTVISGVVGVIAALAGLGAWALAVQYLTNSTIDTIMLWFTVKWRPRLMFSFRRLRFILSYGWKILANGLVDEIYKELRTMVIGKQYSSVDLAFYDKGNRLPNLITTNINSSIAGVLFPVLSRMQDDLPAMKRASRRSARINIYLLFPMLGGFIAAADHIILLMLGEKWLPSVYFARVLTVYYLFGALNSIGRNIMKATGRSDLLLSLGIVKKAYGIAVIFLTMGISIEAMAIGAVTVPVFEYIINLFTNKFLIGYTVREQLADMLSQIWMPIVMSLFVCVINLLSLPTLPTLILQIISGAALYLVLSAVSGNDSFTYLLDTVKRRRKKS